MSPIPVYPVSECSTNVTIMPKPCDMSVHHVMEFFIAHFTFFLALHFIDHS